MARIRTIKPELFVSETLARVPLAAERTFCGLLTQADDRGRLRESAPVLNGALWPCRPEHGVPEMQADLDALVDAGVLCRYEAGGRKYLHFPTWAEHQKISHPSTRNPAPGCPVHDGPPRAHEAPIPRDEAPIRAAAAADSGKSPEGSGKPPQGKERKGKGKEIDLQSLVHGGVRGGEQRTQPATPAAAPARAGARTRAPKRATPTAPAEPRTPAARAPKPARKPAAANTPTGQEDDMGVYDTAVPAFADLRKAGAVRKGKRPVGRNGVSPAHQDAVDQVIAALDAARKAAGGKARVTAGWYADVQALLIGGGDLEAFTAAQLCDLVAFAAQHRFWHAHLATASGLRRHAPKLFASDEYVAWSKANGRPAANRPRDALIQAAEPARRAKGALAADAKRTADDYRVPL